MRIGQGYDAHRFEAGAPLVLGGVRIEHEFGMAAHSDGDVVLHALCDALLGACALGDIGKHFPDSDPALSGVDSRLLLRKVCQLIRDLGWKVINCDMTIMAEKPRMSPHIDAMRANIAADLEIDVNGVSVKATTTEKMGFTGREEGIAAAAIVLLEATA